MRTGKDADPAVWLAAEATYLTARETLAKAGAQSRLRDLFYQDELVYEVEPTSRPFAILRQGRGVRRPNRATRLLQSRSTWRCRRRGRSLALAPSVPAAPRSPAPPSTRRRDPPPLFDAPLTHVAPVQVASLSQAAEAKRRAEEALKQAEATVAAALEDDDRALEDREKDATKGRQKAKLDVDEEEEDESTAGQARNPASAFARSTMTRTLSHAVRAYDRAALAAPTRAVVIAIRYVATYLDAIRPTLRYAAARYIRRAFSVPSAAIPPGFVSPAALRSKLEAIRRVLRARPATQLTPQRRHQLGSALVAELGLTGLEVASLSAETMVGSFKFVSATHYELYANLDAHAVLAADDAARAGWPRLVELVGEEALVKPFTTKLGSEVLVSAVQGAAAALDRTVAQDVEVAVAAIAHPKRRGAVAGPARKAIARFVLEAPLGPVGALAQPPVRDERLTRLRTFLDALILSRGCLAAADVPPIAAALETVAARQTRSLRASLGAVSPSTTARSLLRDSPLELLRWIDRLNRECPAKGETERERGIAPVRERSVEQSDLAARQRRLVRTLPVRQSCFDAHAQGRFRQRPDHPRLLLVRPALPPAPALRPSVPRPPGHAGRDRRGQDPLHARARHGQRGHLPAQPMCVVELTIAI